MNHFFANQQILLSKVPEKFQRSFYKEIDFNNRMIGLVGPRGVGKTTLLLQHLKKINIQKIQILYVSLDDIYFSENKLLDLAQNFIDEYDGKLLVLDEVHKYPNWNQELKNIYDRFPDLKVIFSGSSSLDLIKGNYDLSRRAVIYSLPGLSFREYLELSQGIKFNKFNLKQLIAKHSDIATDINQKIKPLKEIKNYLKTGYYPYSQESKELEYFKKLNTTIEKTIQNDIASFYSLKTNYLKFFYKILYFLATTPPGKISTNNLARNLGIANETIDEYLEYLRNTSLIRYLYIDAQGSKLIRNAEKVFLDNTNLLYAISTFLDKQTNRGQIRELFVLNQLQNAGYKPFFKKEGDLTINNYNFEIGGKGKDWGQLNNTAENFLILDEINS